MIGVQYIAWFGVLRFLTRPAESFAILFAACMAVATAFSVPHNLGEPIIAAIIIGTSVPLIGYGAMSEVTRFFSDIEIQRLELERGVSEKAGKLQFFVISCLFCLLFAVQEGGAFFTRRLSFTIAVLTWLQLSLALIFMLRTVLIVTRFRPPEDGSIGMQNVLLPQVVLAVFVAYIGISCFLIYFLAWSLKSALLIGVVFGFIQLVACFMVEHKFKRTLPRMKHDG